MTRVPRPMAIEYVTEQSAALKQLSLYRDAMLNMGWNGYCAAKSAFFATSPLRRPCHSWGDCGLAEDAFHSDLAVDHGVVFG